MNVVLCHPNPWSEVIARVVSIGRLTAFYVVFVPMEYISSEPPPYTYVIVSFCTLQKDSTFLG